MKKINGGVDENDMAISPVGKMIKNVFVKKTYNLESTAIQMDIVVVTEE